MADGFQIDAVRVENEAAEVVGVVLGVHCGFMQRGCAGVKGSPIEGRDVVAGVDRERHVHVGSDRALVDEPEVGLDLGAPEAGHGGLILGWIGRDFEHLGDSDGSEGGFIEGDGRLEIGDGDVEMVDTGAGAIEAARLRSCHVADDAGSSGHPMTAI